MRTHGERDAAARSSHAHRHAISCDLYITHKHNHTCAHTYTNHRAFQRKNAQVCDPRCEYLHVACRGKADRQAHVHTVVRFDTTGPRGQSAGTRDGPRRSERYAKAAHDAVTLCARKRENGSLIGEAHIRSSRSAVTTLTAECTGP